MDLTVFQATIAKLLFGRKMSAEQRGGCERIINAWEQWGYGLDTALAYILATGYWETGGRMQPVRETFASSTEQAIARLDNAFRKGQLKWVKTPYWREGWFGRGDVQLTHEANYSGPLRNAVWSQFPGVDIHATPDAVLDPQVSAFILIEGVTQGVTLKADFTAYALEDFINENGTDYVNARKTVNPGEKDSYAKVAAIALKFEKAIREARAAAGETFRQGGSENLYNGGIYPEVRQVQQRLRDLGYPEVGNVDGRWGSKSAAAVLAFRHDNGLPTVAKIDEELLVALMRAEKRVVGVERATATAEDLADAPAVQDGVGLTQIGKWIGIGGGAIGLGNGGLKLDQLTNQIGQFQALMVSVQAALPYLLVAGLGFAVFYYGRRIVAQQVQAYREGRHV